MNFNRVFHYKPSILRYPYFWKHPYINKIYTLHINRFLENHTTVRLEIWIHKIYLFWVHSIQLFLPPPPVSKHLIHDFVSNIFSFSRGKEKSLSSPNIFQSFADMEGMPGWPQTPAVFSCAKRAQCTQHCEAVFSIKRALAWRA